LVFGLLTALWYLWHLSYFVARCGTFCCSSSFVQVALGSGAKDSTRNVLLHDYFCSVAWVFVAKGIVVDERLRHENHQFGTRQTRPMDGACATVGAGRPTHSIVGGAHTTTGSGHAKPWASNGSPSQSETVSFFGQIRDVDVAGQASKGLPRCRPVDREASLGVRLRGASGVAGVGGSNGDQIAREVPG
jgi:hypothetical protein